MNLVKTELYSKRVLRLPMHNYLNQKDIKTICKNLKIFFRKLNKEY